MGASAQFDDSKHTLTTIKIPINPPYLRSPEHPVNDLGLPVKEHYRTQDACRILVISPDLFRYRIRTGKYPESTSVNGKRIFTDDYIRALIKK
jgi:hypothetical protein